MNPALTSQSSELSSLAAASRFSRARLSPDAVDNTNPPNQAVIAEVSNLEAAELGGAEAALELAPDLRNIDEFTPFVAAVGDRDGDDDQKRRRKRQERRIGTTKKVSAVDDYDDEDVYGFLGYIDKLWKRLYELVQDVTDEFDNWNKWFKKEKKAPPTPERSRVTYIRDEYQVNRSPHLWKTDPNRNWVLGFGHNKVNNIVSSILYKYQNETISKDA
jgi:hypothetical protein